MVDDSYTIITSAQKSPIRVYVNRKLNQSVAQVHQLIQYHDFSTSTQLESITQPPTLPEIYHRIVLPTYNCILPRNHIFHKPIVHTPNIAPD